MAGESMKTRRRPATKAKRRSAPKAARGRDRFTTTLQEQLDRRTRALNEALERQRATSEVLRVISSSQDELEPVFQSMLANAIAAKVSKSRFGESRIEVLN
jgi:two-component system, NtrC family, sensor kinase